MALNSYGGNGGNGGQVATTINGILGLGGNGKTTPYYYNSASNTILVNPGTIYYGSGGGSVGPTNAFNSGSAGSLSGGGSAGTLVSNTTGGSALPYTGGGGGYNSGGALGSGIVIIWF